MRKIYSIKKSQYYSIPAPLQFPILRLFILNDDILWLNTIKPFHNIHNIRKNQFFKLKYTMTKNFCLYRKMKNNVCIGKQVHHNRL